MSEQLESAHFFREGDTVARSDGVLGVVREEWSLYAIIEWDGGRREELDQFEPHVTVVRRAGA